LNRFIRMTEIEIHFVGESLKLGSATKAFQDESEERCILIE